MFSEKTSSRAVSGDFPGGPVVKNPPSSAGDVGSIPGRGIKIPHAVEQVTGPQLESPHTAMKVFT